jgi:alpha-aminoadipic semialdehyde synthase
MGSERTEVRHLIPLVVKIFWFLLIDTLRLTACTHFHSQGNDSLLGNGVVGILAETVNMWERRAPLTPSHCARLVLGGGRSTSGVNRIIVQPSTKRIHHDAQYEDAGCEISEDLSECGLIIGIKQPKVRL